MTDQTETPERHKDKDRNRIINQTVADLDDVINGHDPEVDIPIHRGVWDRLDKMECDLSADKDKRIAELEALVTHMTPFAKMGNWAAMIWRLL